MTAAMVEPWMQTWSGHAFDLLDPRPEQIHLCDIGMSLERMPRFNGHTARRTWTVAHHSLMVANILANALDETGYDLRLAALLHDAHEAYIGDITAPVKAALKMVAGQDIIERLEEPIKAAVHRRFRVVYPLPAAWEQSIHRADMMALAIEKEWFMQRSPRPWIDLPLPDDPGAEVDAVDLYFRAGFSFAACVTNAVVARMDSNA